jgi:hypothetical protein
MGERADDISSLLAVQTPLAKIQGCEEYLRPGCPQAPSKSSEDPKRVEKADRSKSRLRINNWVMDV